MDTSSQLRLAIEERDKALAKVAGRSSEWIERALSLIPNIRRDGLPHARRLVSGEDVRVWLEQRMDPPHHHNAYGALIRTAIKRKILLPTDQFVQMRTKKSHARMTRLYEVN